MTDTEAPSQRMHRPDLGYRRRLESSLRDARLRVMYLADATSRESVRRLRALHGSLKGRRGFIICNGPSLNEMDLSPLAGEITFALNRGYLLQERIGACPTYLVAVNRHVIDQYSDDIVAAEALKFFSWQAAPHMSERSDVFLVRSRITPGFYADIAQDGFWEGATVTYAALQIAYFVGCTEVILIGADHYFATRGRPGELVVSTGTDPNHFDPNYFGAGARWQLPDLEMSEVAYGMARSAYERAGRRVRNATLGGKLEIFERVNYESLF